MPLIVRPIRPHEDRTFLDLQQRSVRGLAHTHYPLDVVDAWAAPMTEERLRAFRENTDNEIRLIAALDGEPVGMGALVVEHGELRACYVVPEAARQGVGTAIVHEIERLARQHGLKQLEVLASLNAEVFYERLGYESIGRMQHVLGGGQRMAAVKMVKNWDRDPISRRQFGVVAGTWSTTSVASGCGLGGVGQPDGGLLTARPSATTTTLGAGTHSLAVADAPDAVVYVPERAEGTPLPLIVLLHGAGGSGAALMRRVVPAAEALAIAVVAPSALGRTWDALQGEYRSVLDLLSGRRRSAGFGADVRGLDRALERVFDTIGVDPGRIAIGGFSDGATYALSLGLMNGDLFRHIVAWSPGFVMEGEPRGRPRIFISHGKQDEILPIDRCSRRIVPLLRTSGYRVTFREFEGGHDVPAAVAREGLAMVAADSAST